MKNEIIPYNENLKKNARKLRKESTLSEVLLWENLKCKKIKGYRFLRQRPIDNYIVDFYCPELKLAIEIDGASHDFKESYEEDIVRQKIIEQTGVRFLRFKDIDVKRDMMNVIRGIEIWIEEEENNRRHSSMGNKNK